MKVKAIYVNLPIKDVAATRAFWTALGFSFNEQFSDDKAICMVLNEGLIYAMLLSEPFFTGFTNRPIASGTTQVINAIEVESREKVNELVQLALDNGATRYRQGEDHGWMYYDCFADPNGHQWEIMYSDASQFPQQ